jgi:transposase-like protein
MEEKRKKFSSEFKAKIGLAAMSRMNTIAELAETYEVHPSQIMKWKAQLQQRAPDIFGDKRKKENFTQERIMENLYKQIGQQKVENDWLKKKVGLFSE